MIDQLNFEFYCKSASLFKRGFSDMLEETPDFEQHSNAKSIIFIFNNEISKRYYRNEMHLRMKYNCVKKLKTYDNFTNPDKIQKHYKNICDFLKKQAEKYNLTLSFVHHLAFAVSLRDVGLTNWDSEFAFIKDKYVDLDLVMKQLSFVDIANPSGNTNLYVTTGDLNFIFSAKLRENFTRNDVTKPYFSCTQTGDIRLIYKSLMVAVAHRNYFDRIIEKDDDYKPPSDYLRIVHLINKEFELIQGFDLMGELFEYSKKVQYRFQCDDEYELVDADSHFTRRLPFFCVPTLPARCNLKQITAMLLSTYYQASIGRTSKTVLSQTYSLVYPVIEDLCKTYIFEEYCKEISKIIGFEINVSEFVNEMDLNCYGQVDFIELKRADEDKIEYFKEASSNYYNTIRDEFFWNNFESFFTKEGEYIRSKWDDFDNKNNVGTLSTETTETSENWSSGDQASISDTHRECQERTVQ